MLSTLTSVENKECDKLGSSVAVWHELRYDYSAAFIRLDDRKCGLFVCFVFAETCFVFRICTVSTVRDKFTSLGIVHF